MAKTKRSDGTPKFDDLATDVIDVLTANGWKQAGVSRAGFWSITQLSKGRQAVEVFTPAGQKQTRVWLSAAKGGQKAVKSALAPLELAGIDPAERRKKGVRLVRGVRRSRAKKNPAVLYDEDGFRLGQAGDAETGREHVYYGITAKPSTHRADTRGGPNIWLEAVAPDGAVAWTQTVQEARMHADDRELSRAISRIVTDPEHRSILFPDGWTLRARRKPTGARQNAPAARRQGLPRGWHVTSSGPGYQTWKTFDGAKRIKLTSASDVDSSLGMGWWAAAWVHDTTSDRGQQKGWRRIATSPRFRDVDSAFEWASKTARELTSRHPRQNQPTLTHMGMEYGPRYGLDGPFNFSGRILYYDTRYKGGRYYDPRSDMYLERDDDPHGQRRARQNPITGARRNPTTTLAGFANPPTLRKASRGIPPALRNRGE